MNSRIINSGAIALTAMAMMVSPITSTNSNIINSNACSDFSLDSLSSLTCSTKKYEYIIQKSNRSIALELFGEQRLLTDSELEDYNLMLESHSRNTGVNIFELYS